MPNEPQKTDKQIRDEIVSKAMAKIRDPKSPTKPPRKDLVIEAREWCESSDAMLDEPMRQRLAQLCNEVERLKRGDFTAEELQNLCHNWNSDDRSAFFEGCTKYQEQLFGTSAVAEARKGRK